MIVATAEVLMSMRTQNKAKTTRIPGLNEILASRKHQRTTALSILSLAQPK